MLKDLETVLRDTLVERSKLDRSIAKKAGISRQVIKEFIRGGEMTLRQASTLSTYFGLELREARVVVMVLESGMQTDKMVPNVAPVRITPASERSEVVVAMIYESRSPTPRKKRSRSAKFSRTK